MTVKELKKKLEQYPDNMDVFIDERVTDFSYGLFNTVSSKVVDFMEEPGGVSLCKDTVVVLSE